MMAIDLCDKDSTIYPHNDQLPFGLMAQREEHCTGIAKVRLRIPFGPPSLLQKER